MGEEPLYSHPSSEFPDYRTWGLLEVHRFCSSGGNDPAATSFDKKLAVVGIYDAIT